MPTLDLPPLELSRARELDDESLIRIIMQYHDAHVRDLMTALELAQAVSARHADSPDLPARLPEQIADLLEDLRGHQAREESVLFPVILCGRGETLRYPIAALGTDHDTVQVRLEQLVRLTRDYTPPEGACATWRRLYDVCRKFDRELREHVQLEERVLFPRFA
ncbi:hemerythrin domain-containing protein [Phenylobacterium sp.]|uniref:hemerythrin domain-containing protein n=1 Tax=Phenylobacterium sp. TaxID=1871053 RepID=UPI002F933C46